MPARSCSGGRAFGGRSRLYPLCFCVRRGGATRTRCFGAARTSSTLCSVPTPLRARRPGRLLGRPTPHPTHLSSPEISPTAPAPKLGSPEIFPSALAQNLDSLVFRASPLPAISARSLPAIPLPLPARPPRDPRGLPCPESRAPRARDLFSSKRATRGNGRRQRGHEGERAIGLRRSSRKEKEK